MQYIAPHRKHFYIDPQLSAEKINIQMEKVQLLIFIILNSI